MNIDRVTGMTPRNSMEMSAMVDPAVDQFRATATSHVTPASTAIELIEVCEGNKDKVLRSEYSLYVACGSSWTV